MSDPYHHQFGVFLVETDRVDAGRLTIDVQGLGTITINRTHEGLIADVFPYHIVDEPIHTMALLNEDFAEEEE